MRIGMERADCLLVVGDKMEKVEVAQIVLSVKFSSLQGFFPQFAG